MELLVCGGLKIDYVITAAGEVFLNQIGGNGIYAAVGARVYTNRVHLLAKTGENFPQSWLDELPSHGILCDNVVLVPGWHDIRTFYAYIDERTRDDRNPSAHFERLGLPLPAELEGYEYSTIETQNPASPVILKGKDVPDIPLDGVHICPIALSSQYDLTRIFSANNVEQISLDPGEYELTSDTAPVIRSICSQIDTFLPSELEIALLVDLEDIYEAAEIFGSWGTPIVVIKRGPDGCLVYERDAHRFTRIPAYPAKVVDVTGAGDAFGGAYTIGMVRTGDPVHSAMMGAVAASFGLEGFGALYGLDVNHKAAQERMQWLTDRM